MPFNRNKSNKPYSSKSSNDRSKSDFKSSTNRGGGPRSNKPGFKKPFVQDGDELTPPRFIPKNRDTGDREDFRANKSKSYGDKPYGKKASNDKPYGDKPYAKKSYGDKPYGDKPYAKKAYGDKPYAKKSNGDKSFGDKTYGDKPFGKKSYGDKPYGDKPYNKRREGSDSGFDRDRKSSFDRSERSPRSNDRFNDKPRFKDDRGARNDRFSKDQDGDRKPFRPKYDPEVKIKKTYSQRKQDLMGITDDPSDIRLNKYIANSGVCSRREADDLISQGLVTVNGEPVVEMGYKVKKTDVVRYDGRKILPEPFVYILMNKPKDFITTTDDEKGRKTVLDLLADKIPQRVYPIGRLDRNTTGVLLLTNDGEVSQAMTHPSFQIGKVYHAVLDKKISGTDLDKLVQGIELEDGLVHADAATFVDNEDRRHVGVEIHSGKNRVVRRMFEALGYEVEKLDRVSMGIFTKKDLPRGKWRLLKESEIGFLMKLKSKM
jgi:23S rRNA pseudouridine2605 synthase